jgi:hypothetical protein
MILIGGLGKPPYAEETIFGGLGNPPGSAPGQASWDLRDEPALRYDACRVGFYPAEHNHSNFNPFKFCGSSTHPQPIS